MSLENLFLVFEGPLVFLYSNFSDRSIGEERREEKHNCLNHWPGQLKHFSQALLICDPP